MVKSTVTPSKKKRTKPLMVDLHKKQQNRGTRSPRKGLRIRRYLASDTSPSSKLTSLLNAADEASESESSESPAVANMIGLLNAVNEASDSESSEAPEAPDENRYFDDRDSESFEPSDAEDKGDIEEYLDSGDSEYVASSQSEACDSSSEASDSASEASDSSVEDEQEGNAISEEEEDDGFEKQEHFKKKAFLEFCMRKGIYPYLKRLYKNVYNPKHSVEKREKIAHARAVTAINRLLTLIHLSYSKVSQNEMFITY